MVQENDHLCCPSSRCPSCPVQTAQLPKLPILFQGTLLGNLWNQLLGLFLTVEKWTLGARALLESLTHTSVVFTGISPG